ncbi:MAG: DUF6448 family protein [Dehalococcoidia bacterium]|jgi:hypothetical protein|nr:DUF6448 family protein [Dehalococcoidia bacterium]
MPPHCDTLDGPVVKAAREALESGNVNLILPWVPRKGEGEVKRAFSKARRVRSLGRQAADLADRWFFETVVRVHRAGEGAAYTGLKPAGLDWGPVVRRAEHAIEAGNADDVIGFLSHTVENALRERFEKVMATRSFEPTDVAAAREFVQAQLGFVLWSHGLYSFVTGGGGHGEEGSGGHEH